MNLHHLVFLDLETTGVNTLHDRIIEIGLCDVREGILFREWATLVNPGKTFSPFIEHLTGISHAMVAEAPVFEEIARELFELLDGKVLVAHNARFDCGFLNSEFRRLGIPFQGKALCTVKLSRALFPKEPRHNLDTLIQRHGLAVSNRHRAIGDARVIKDFFLKLRSELPREMFDQAVARQMKQPFLPAGLLADQVEALPHTPGVYRFFGENDALLYVGKSVDIHSRVLSHFTNDHRASRGMRLAQQVRRIDCLETAGELGALLLEARLVKEMAPLHNRRLRRTRELFTLRLVPGAGGTSLPEIVPVGEAGHDQEPLFGIFRSRREAEKILWELVRTQGLCARILGMEKGDGACFGYQIKKCRGACVGTEPLALHQARWMMALAALRWRPWPFTGAVGIRETAPGGDRTEIHVIDGWRHLGTAHSEEGLREIFEGKDMLPWDLDNYRILTRILNQKKSRVEIVNLSRFRDPANRRETMGQNPAPS